MPYTVTKTISFSYGHRLLDYSGKCKYLHGHNGRAEITLRSDKLDKRGMVLDFTDIKNTLGSFIKDKLDHKIILSKKDPLAPVLKKMGEPYFEMETNPTAENIAHLIFVSAKKHKLPIMSVKLWETDTSYALYQE